MKQLPMFEIDDEKPLTDVEISGGIFSPCRKYRYQLWRRWGHGEGCVFIGLNPSTADEKVNDPTIRRCINYAKRWNFDAMVMLNLFAFRATDPADMQCEIDPVGPDNDLWIRAATDGAFVVCCWGAHGSHLSRSTQVLELIPKTQSVFCLGLTKSGEPKHPLYLRSDLNPIEWNL